MSKDKIIGLSLALIFLVGLILYTYVVPITLLLDVVNGSPSGGLLPDLLPISGSVALFWLMVPVFGGVFLFSFIVIWIGWTMATTPPPEPIDLDSLDLDDDDEDEEKEN